MIEGKERRTLEINLQQSDFAWMYLASECAGKKMYVYRMLVASLYFYKEFRFLLLFFGMQDTFTQNISAIGHFPV
eukprot:c7395_g1_i1 orf=115-339(-)